MKVSPIVLFFLMGFFILGTTDSTLAQKGTPYFVNKKGVLIESSTKKEVSYFGVNYSPPFAHGYRALKQLGASHKETIDQDVYHFARLGFDAFRIHIWDTEISDSLGNLVPNVHLDLLDYLIFKLKQRQIKIIITPLTFYDNAYPDGATPTPGFSNYISKENAPKNSSFYPVIKNYLGQILNHKNPYTGLSYAEDSDIIATEIINEPTHYGPENDITNFIDELAKHIRKQGWKKPVFYNIAQNPSVVDAVMKANVDGLSFQWYPAGLVGGKALNHNYMPYINDYPIPFSNGKGFSNKALMVYEFDAADNSMNYSYPLMARSLREAGFQWATQFAYEPTPIAPYNSDYQTHYLNISYTPGRALSMMIAAEVFRQTPRKAEFTDFLSDSVFGDFRISHQQNLSELNSKFKFYYSNSTTSKPLSLSDLKHIAGVGSSSIVDYEGTGAYFLDKLSDGVWRLEVMPDAISISNPFDKPSFEKMVTKIKSGKRKMTISLPDLPKNYLLKGVNNRNNYTTQAIQNSIIVEPGSYILLADSDVSEVQLPKIVPGFEIQINEFFAPNSHAFESAEVIHHSPNEVSADKEWRVSATITGVKTDQKVAIIAYPLVRMAESYTMKEVKPNMYEAILPKEFMQEGVLRYWITIGEGDSMKTYPGGNSGSPWDWNYYQDVSWNVRVIPSKVISKLFDADIDFENINFTFNSWDGKSKRKYVFSTSSGRLSVQLTSESFTNETQSILGMSNFVENRAAIVENGQDELILITKSLNSEEQILTVVLVNADGIPFSTDVTLTSNSDKISVQLSEFKQGKMALLPRPYPTFLPFWFKPNSQSKLIGSHIEIVQVMLVPEKNEHLITKPVGFNISEISLRLSDKNITRIFK